MDEPTEDLTHVVVGDLNKAAVELNMIKSKEIQYGLFAQYFLNFIK